MKYGLQKTIMENQFLTTHIQNNLLEKELQLSITIT